MFVGCNHNSQLQNNEFGFYFRKCSYNAYIASVISNAQHYIIGHYYFIGGLVTKNCRRETFTGVLLSVVCHNVLWVCVVYNVLMCVWKAGVSIHLWKVNGNGWPLSVIA